jgi:hypothetical protein
MNILIFFPGVICMIAALLVMFRLMHYARFYAPSYFFWIGTILAIIGLVSLIQPLIFLFVFNRMIAAFVLIGGILISAVSLLWPATMHHSSTDLEIDKLLPDYTSKEYHEVIVNASVEAAKQTLQSTGVSDIPVVHLLLKIRGIADEKDMSNAAANNRACSDTFSTPDFNFFVVNPNELITVMILQASMITNGSKKIPAPPEITKLEQFSAFNQPGYVKVAVNFRFVNRDNGQTLMSTETRNWPVTKKDARTFGIYWRIIYPGSAMIRRIWLDVINKKAQLLNK